MPTLLFGTSCSLQAAPWAAAAIVGYRLRALPLDYSQRSFFPDSSQHLESRYGAFAQCVAVKRGAGRVVAFTDSTIFSNFFIFVPGKAELALGLVEWAYRSNVWTDVTRGVGVFGLLVLLVSLVRGGRKAPLASGGAVALGAALAVNVAHHANAAAYAPPMPRDSYVSVGFDGEHSDFFIPDRRLANGTEEDFDPFFVWVQRLGYVPRKWERLEEAIAKSDVLVVINPRSGYGPAEAARVREYVESGGGLLIMDHASNDESTVDGLLDAFGVKLDWSASDTQSPALSAAQRAAFDGAGDVQGLEPDVVAPDGRVLLASSRVGAGRLFVCSNSRMFERDRFGYVNQIPTDATRPLHELEFAILRCLVDPERAFSFSWGRPSVQESQARPTVQAPALDGAVPREDGK